VVAINRALAVAEVKGAEVAIKALEEFGDDARLTQYQPFWAARADLLARVGKDAEARRSYELAVGLEGDDPVRRFFQRRQSALMQ
jgi:RNA polymerase sigma-70 factor (ECF subfamily)